MLKNYFKTAIAVLRRRKFFTFISLFGIAFTLTIVTVLAAFVDNTVSANYPEVHRDRSLYITLLKQENTKDQGQWNSPASFYYLDKYVSTLKTPEKVAISSFFNPTNAYRNGRKLAVNLKYTNAPFWEVMQFDFIEGKPFTEQQVANGERVAVISEDTKRDYFGNAASVAGQTIEVDNQAYRVSGVVKSVPVTMPIAHADMYVPYTVSKADYRQPTLMGNYTAVLLGRSEADLPAMQAEYAAVVARVKPEAKGFDVFKSNADPYLSSFLRNSPFGDTDDGGVGRAMMAGALILLLFMLLPALNLVNINISRIMERSSEIGVRKAFGASGHTLVGQFIVENLILTFLGCCIGILVSFVAIQVINGAGLINNIHLTINGTVLGFSLIACVVFGLLSGVYPAWRMSRLQVVQALKDR
ncbi:ABC transporter permease [Flaviaesturariibacter amylovorans]|uniref:ABC transporter permease n=1 Tax=Flaviaesturariibacter amylovorans TaxID=1084520 RepID=A0ABP8H824_9BACT